MTLHGSTRFRRLDTKLKDNGVMKSIFFWRNVKGDGHSNRSWKESTVTSVILDFNDIAIVPPFVEMGISLSWKG